MENIFLRDNDLEFLKQKSIPVLPGELEQIKNELIPKLFKFLAFNRSASWISANQVGILKRVGVLNVLSSKALINPEIVLAKNRIITIENNVCFANKICNTERFSYIKVISDDVEIQFGSENLDDPKENLKVYEAVAVQALIDNMDGILMWNRVPKKEAEKRQDFYRNEIITIVKDDKIQKIKYKFLSKFTRDGWTILK